MQAEKFIIIIETSFLGCYDNKGKLISKNFKYLSINKEIFESLIRFVNDNALTDNIHIAIPKIVFEEIKEQEKREFTENCSILENTFKKFRELEGFTYGKRTLDFEKHLDGKIDAFVGVYNIIVLDNPPNNVLPKLIEKALKKYKPFYKSSKNDSGFKDALIWESILEYAKSNKTQTYIFLTKDPDFNDEHLLTEFKKTVGSDLILKDDLSKVKSFLDERVKLNLDFTSITGSYNQIFMEKIISVMSYCYPYIEHHNGVYKINEYFLSNQLEDIKTMDGCFELIIPLVLRHETEYTGDGIVDDIYKPYEYRDFQDKVRIKVKKNQDGSIYLVDISFNSGKIKKISTFKDVKLN